ncbi:MAG TPA: hypothetical protein ENK26_03825 [Gammaproteobacteria bacterium]|nr:hypothetical protein [Gammaproteobacteria bacterium]
MRRQQANRIDLRRGFLRLRIDSISLPERREMRVRTSVKFQNAFAGGMQALQGKRDPGVHIIRHRAGEYRGGNHWPPRDPDALLKKTALESG